MLGTARAWPDHLTVRANACQLRSDQRLRYHVDPPNQCARLLGPVRGRPDLCRVDVHSCVGYPTVLDKVRTGDVDWSWQWGNFRCVFNRDGDVANNTFPHPVSNKVANHTFSHNVSNKVANNTFSHNVSNEGANGGANGYTDIPPYSTCLPHPAARLRPSYNLL